MNPAEYLDHLDRGSLREGLPASELRPCSSADVTSVEREVGMALPEQYVDFLCQVGAGDEFGGLGRWFHLDVTRPGNILARSLALTREQLQLMRDAGIPASHYPKGLLLFYDPHDGALYGFLPASESAYKPEVFCWDCEEYELEEVAGTFFGFLSYLCEESSDVEC